MIESKFSYLIVRERIFIPLYWPFYLPYILCFINLVFTLTNRTVLLSTNTITFLTQPVHFSLLRSFHVPSRSRLFSLIFMTSILHPLVSSSVLVMITFVFNCRYFILPSHELNKPTPWVVIWAYLGCNPVAQPLNLSHVQFEDSSFFPRTHD